MAKKKDADKFVLTEPVEFGSEIFTEFTLRKPKTKEIRGLSFNESGAVSLDDLLTVGENLVDQPRAVVNEMSAADGFRLAGVVSDFLMSGPPTGKK